MMFQPEAIRARVQELLSIELDEEEARLLSRFAELLLKWNATYNLTSITSSEEVIDLHLVDSLALVKYADKYLNGEKSVLDVGSGGGLPAIPLAIMRPELHITMVDAVQKKTIFQRQAIAMCRLKNIEAVHARVETIKNRQFDLVTSRAFSSLSEMIRLTEHLLAPEGLWIAMKGKFPEKEIEDLPKNVRVRETMEVKNLNFERHLIVLEKFSSSIPSS